VTGFPQVEEYCSNSQGIMHHNAVIYTSSTTNLRLPMYMCRERSEIDYLMGIASSILSLESAGRASFA
jgi:hypothetical protein